MSRDIVDELSEMVHDEKRKAFDAGAVAIMDSVITLCKMSGGRLNLRQLLDYKDYIVRGLERTNSENQTEAQQQEDAAPVQSVPRRTHAEVVELIGFEQTVGSDVPEQAEESQAGQASEAVTQAEQG